MISTLLTVLAALAASVFTVAFLAFAVLCWIAAGESDVNGEKERDAGSTNNSTPTLPTRPRNWQDVYKTQNKRKTHENAKHQH